MVHIENLSNPMMEDTAQTWTTRTNQEYKTAFIGTRYDASSGKDQNYLWLKLSGTFPE
jgi:hypothetical protein